MVKFKDVKEKTTANFFRKRRKTICMKGIIQTSDFSIAIRNEKHAVLFSKEHGSLWKFSILYMMTW